MLPEEFYSMITPLISTCAKISYSTWTAQRGNTNKILGRILQVFRYVMKSFSFDSYLQKRDFVWEPAGRKSFFFFFFFHQNQPNLRSLPIAVSYLSVFFFLINSQSLGSLLITSWCLTCDKTLRLVFKLSNYIVSGAIYCRYWLTVKGTGMKRKKEIELESWHRDFLFLLCRACIAMF